DPEFGLGVEFIDILPAGPAAAGELDANRACRGGDSRGQFDSAGVGRGVGIHGGADSPAGWGFGGRCNWLMRACRVVEPMNITRRRITRFRRIHRMGRAGGTGPMVRLRAMRTARVPVLT